MQFLECLPCGVLGGFQCTVLTFARLFRVVAKSVAVRLLGSYWWLPGVGEVACQSFIFRINVCSDHSLM